MMIPIEYMICLAWVVSLPTRSVAVTTDWFI